MMKTLAVASLILVGSVAFAQGNSQPQELYTPSMIPHPIAAYTPITPERNTCGMCHVPATAGQQKAKGMPAPLPASHLENGKMAPSRYECLICHVEAEPKK